MVFILCLCLIFLQCFDLTTASDQIRSIIGDESECETIGGDKCVFPFSYQGRTYFACTADDSDNGAPWCAVQVQADSRRTVLRGKWEDCSPECPGYDLSGEIARYFQSRKRLKKYKSVCLYFCLSVINQNPKTA